MRPSAGKRSLWITLAGLAATAILAAVLAGQLPTALQRNDRARDVATLQREIAAVRTQVSDVGSQTGSLRTQLATQQSANDDLNGQIADQSSKIAKQQKVVKDLRKKIRSVSG